MKPPLLLHLKLERRFKTLKQQQVSIVILAGGKSMRMGQDKASLPWGDQDILHNIIDCMKKVSQDISCHKQSATYITFLRSRHD
jgi:molybdopterin-guanine dinucleotide biosynthesis protein A